MDIHTLTFSTKDREKAQLWHDANDEDDDHMTVDRKLKYFRHKWSETARLRREAAARLETAPPCQCCGAVAGEPCRKLK
jgi:hypothetical protein